jgi:hypothetical protein
MSIAKPNLTSWLFFHNVEELFYYPKLVSIQNLFVKQKFCTYLQKQ